MRLRAALGFIALILLAGALRLPQLAARPMHADEAIHADKLGTLLAGGGYAYDPADYHGPTLYYLTLPVAWLAGARRHVDLDEVTLRLVPALLGIALAAAHAGARRSLGTPAALVAALLTALSPGLVYYSRYYIHETPLVLASFGLLLAVLSYLRRPRAGAAILAGACAGLMHATKETAAIALASLLGALAITLFLERRRRAAGPGGGGLDGTWRPRHGLLAVVVAAAVSGLLYSSFLAQPAGIADSLRSFALQARRAVGPSPHAQARHYYLRLLLHAPANDSPFWSEGLIAGLALIGGSAAWVRAEVPAADGRALRVLSLYAVLLLVSYSAIPYKTPWCVLGMLHAMVLLAGVGGVIVLRAMRARAARVLAAVALLAGASHLGWQAYVASFRLASDPRNPYVYGHTGPDVFEIARSLHGLARAHDDGRAVPIDVIGRENLWPLPWYLRDLSGVRWWTGMPEAVPAAPVVVITPDLEPQLLRRLYDRPPPGERELYVSIFERPLELRPGVELRAYAALSLWQAYGSGLGASSPPEQDP